MSVLFFKNFIGLSNSEKDVVLQWRNSDFIRTKMTNQDLISKNSHYLFIDSLQNKNDSIYNLVFIDDTPIGVSDFVDINYIKKTYSGGMYIGNSDYMGYGIPILFYDYKFWFEEKGFDRTEFIILKNNKRIYEMQKKIFFAHDLCETDKCWHLFHDQESWKKIKSTLESKMCSFYCISKSVRN